MIYNLIPNKEGHLPKLASEAIKRELLSLAGKRTLISIEKYTKKRSTQQNAYYHSVCVKIISDHTGYTIKEVHELLKESFLGTKEIKIGDKTSKVPNSTTKLSTTDFMAYIASIQQWASENLQIYLPDPNELIQEYK
jgi:hypothetical protein